MQVSFQWSLRTLRTAYALHFHHGGYFAQDQRPYMTFIAVWGSFVPKSITATPIVSWEIIRDMTTSLCSLSANCYHSDIGIQRSSIITNLSRIQNRSRKSHWRRVRLTRTYNVYGLQIIAQTIDVLFEIIQAAGLVIMYRIDLMIKHERRGKSSHCRVLSATDFAAATPAIQSLPPVPAFFRCR